MGMLENIASAYQAALGQWKARNICYPRDSGCIDNSLSPRPRDPRKSIWIWLPILGTNMYPDSSSRRRAILKMHTSTSAGREYMGAIEFLSSAIFDCSSLDCAS
ncbi:hypothetical protein PILCRDRAFT_274768 [Piloderma croceum F 1598]|uniref:Uncharacterized protein n=1 Tax=Piloderma croceum (strain F 1598) TaxID=765440 RepID=A0A0C3FT46_PILCF|nr:hypothetical protein PILCRDRAFT_274768 [Piloderma croceum F 1598]